MSSRCLNLEADDVTVRDAWFGFCYANTYLSFKAKVALIVADVQVNVEDAEKASVSSRYFEGVCIQQTEPTHNLVLQTYLCLYKITFTFDVVGPRLRGITCERKQTTGDILSLNRPPIPLWFFYF